MGDVASVTTIGRPGRGELLYRLSRSLAALKRLCSHWATFRHSALFGKVLLSTAHDGHLHFLRCFFQVCRARVAHFWPDWIQSCDIATALAPPDQAEKIASLTVERMAKLHGFATLVYFFMIY